MGAGAMHANYPKNANDCAASQSLCYQLATVAALGVNECRVIWNGLAVSNPAIPTLSSSCCLEL